jgi:hypothetical protein
MSGPQSVPEPSDSAVGWGWGGYAPPQPAYRGGLPTAHPDFAATPRAHDELAWYLPTLEQLDGATLLTG